jgi:hypothetical protein
MSNRALWTTWGLWTTGAVLMGTVVAKEYDS